MSIRRTVFSVTAGIALGIGVGIPALPAQPASAFCAPQHWQDEYTYGGACPGSDTYYYAAVPCENGAVARGPAVRGTWSYAYCSKHGSRILPGAKGNIYPR